MRWIILMSSLCLLLACTGLREPSSTDRAEMGDLLSYEEIPERCCAMRLQLRYTNRLDHRAYIECRFEVTSKDGSVYPRWVTTPEPLSPENSMRFSTISEFGAYDNAEDVRITSCKEAPD